MRREGEHLAIDGVEVVGAEALQGLLAEALGQIEVAGVVVELRELEVHLGAVEKLVRPLPPRLDERVRLGA
jgi:hypothetical protein